MSRQDRIRGMCVHTTERKGGSIHKKPRMCPYDREVVRVGVHTLKAQDVSIHNRIRVCVCIK